MNCAFVWIKHPLKTLWLIISLLFLFPIAYAQELVDLGFLAPIKYEINGPKDHENFPSLIHALAYSQKKEAAKVKAIKTYSVHFKVQKIPSKGFETTITLYLQPFIGDISLYNFYWPQIVLPSLKSFKIIMTNDKGYIYVKNVEINDSNQDTLLFTFKHQRYSSSWDINVKDVCWKQSKSEDEFRTIWRWMNDYQSAKFMLNEENKLTPPSNNYSKLIYKYRWIEIYNQIEDATFFKELVSKMKQDPDQLKNKIEIRKYIINREIAQLTNNAKLIFNNKSFVQAYIKPDLDLYSITQKDRSIYSPIYYSFNPRNKQAFCFSLLDSIFNNNRNKKREFELYYQKLSMQKIDDNIANKSPQEALFQIEKFDAFYSHAEYLKKSSIFSHYKSKAVYGIYLSYIQVARQALEHNRVNMAMKYLDQASLVQRKYPSEIINDIYVEKELQNLVKQALERYKKLIDKGENESAKQVKEGIIGLMKHFGFKQSSS